MEFIADAYTGDPTSESAIVASIRSQHGLYFLIKHLLYLRFLIIFVSVVVLLALVHVFVDFDVVIR